MRGFEIRGLETAPAAGADEGLGLRAWMTEAAWPAGWRAWGGAMVRDELDGYWSADGLVLAPALGVGFWLVEAPIRLARERPLDREAVGWLPPPGLVRRGEGVVRRPFVRLARMIAPVRRRLRALGVAPLPALCGLVVERMPPAAADEDPLHSGIVSAADPAALAAALGELAGRLRRRADPAWAGYLSTLDEGPLQDMFAPGVHLDRGVSDWAVDPLAPGALLSRAARWWGDLGAALDEGCPPPDAEILRELALAERGLVRPAPGPAGELAALAAVHGYAPHDVAWLADDHARLLRHAPPDAALPGDPEAAGRPLVGAAADYAEAEERRRLVILLDPPPPGPAGARLRAIAAATADEAVWLARPEGRRARLRGPG